MEKSDKELARNVGTALAVGFFIRLFFRWWDSQPTDSKPESDDRPQGEPPLPTPTPEPVPEHLNTGDAPIAVGDPSDPEIAVLLQELEAELFALGAPAAGNWTAREVTTMRKAPGQPVAIPPRALWPNMVPALQLFQQLRDEIGAPLKIGNGYRPPDYNAAVGGAPNSAHIYFAALDLDPLSEDRAAVALLSAQRYREGGNMGLGIYGAENPSRTHVDFGRGRRRWEDSQVWIDRAAEAIA